MASSASRIIWGIVAAIGVMVLLLGVVFGPDLVRKGRAVAGPIMEISKAEEEGKALEAEFPFTAPADGELSANRLEDFLSMRGALAPLYAEMVTVERRVEKQGENWQSAAEVLEVVRQVVNAQNRLLREREMSLSEFRWLEDLVYDTWLAQVDKGGSGDPPWVVDRLESLTRDDLEHLDQAVTRFGSSGATRAFRQRLEARLEQLEEHRRPTVEDVPEATQELLWVQYDRIASLRLEESSGLHSRLESAGGNVRVELGDAND